MKNLKERIANLKTAIKESQDEVDEKKACKILKKQFGRDFPVPEEEIGAMRTSAPALLRNDARSA